MTKNKVNIRTNVGYLLCIKAHFNLNRIKNVLFTEESEYK